MRIFTQPLSNDMCVSAIIKTTVLMVMGGGGHYDPPPQEAFVCLFLLICGLALFRFPVKLLNSKLNV